MASLLCSLFELKSKKQLYKYGFEVHFGKAAFSVSSFYLVHPYNTHPQHMRSTVHLV